MMKKCKFCAEEIQDEAIKCKHCGEFLNQSTPLTQKEKGQQAQLKINSKDLSYFSWSWKRFFVSLLIASLLNIFFAGAINVDPAKNIYWTILWVYLTIDAWKYWKWKALLPFPISIILGVIFLFLSLLYIEDDILRPAFLILFLMSNILGLILFHFFLYKSKHKIIGTTPAKLEYIELISKWIFNILYVVFTVVLFGLLIYWKTNY